MVVFWDNVLATVNTMTDDEHTPHTGVSGQRMIQHWTPVQYLFVTTAHARTTRITLYT